MYALLGAISCFSLIVIIGLICGVRTHHVIKCVGSSLIIMLFMMAIGLLALEFMGGSIIELLQQKAIDGRKHF
jgi:hypothetical protein